MEKKKASDKIQHPFIKSINKLGIQGKSLHMKKGICLSHTYNPTGNTILSGKSFPLKIRNKARMTAFATFATSIQLEVPTRAMRKYKDLRRL